jgi:hypothetical protein
VHTLLKRKKNSVLLPRKHHTSDLESRWQKFNTQKIKEVIEVVKSGFLEIKNYLIYMWFVTRFA